MFVFITNYRSTHFFAQNVVTCQCNINFYVVNSVTGLNLFFHYIGS